MGEAEFDDLLNDEPIDSAADTFGYHAICPQCSRESDGAFVCWSCQGHYCSDCVSGWSFDPDSQGDYVNCPGCSAAVNEDYTSQPAFSPYDEASVPPHLGNYIDKSSPWNLGEGLDEFDDLFDDKPVDSDSDDFVSELHYIWDRRVPKPSEEILQKGEFVDQIQAILDQAGASITIWEGDSLTIEVPGQDVSQTVHLIGVMKAGAFGWELRELMHGYVLV